VKNDKTEERRRRKEQKDRETIGKMNKRLSGEQKRVSYRPGDMVTMSDGTQYQVTKSGAWVKVR